MNFVFRLLSPLLFKMARRYGPQLPGLDSGRISRGTRRLGGALLLGALSLVLFTSGVLLGLVDVAIQYEQHGELTWNPILWLCVGVLGLGVASAAGARTMMPGVRDFVPFAPRRAAGPKRSADLPVEGNRPPRRPEYAH